MVSIKRVYEKPEKADGFRILVDRLWPRGINKEKSKIDLWLKDIAPGKDLRTWFCHDPEKWDAFRNRYFKELEALNEADGPLGVLLGHAHKGAVTLLYAAKDEHRNNAAALREYLRSRYKL